MNTPIKRLHYFDQQFLRATDFTAEQDYHRDMRRGLNRVLARWGVADGLTVTVSGSAVAVSAGFGLDAQGREIVLAADTVLDLADQPADSNVYVTIRYADRTTDPTDETGVRDDTRWTEEPELSAGIAPPDEPETELLLAVVERTGTQVTNVTPGDRRSAGVGWLESELNGRLRRDEDGHAAPLALPVPGTGARGVLHVQYGSNQADGATGISFSGHGVDPASAQAGIYMQSADSYGTRLHFATTDDYGAGAKARMTIDQHGSVGIGLGAAAPERRLHVEDSEIHSGGPAAGLSFANRESAWDESGAGGARWVWYSSGGIARLWAGGDRLLAFPNGDLRVTGQLGVGPMDPRDGLPSGWTGGVHAVDVVARGTVAATRDEGGTIAVKAWMNTNGDLGTANDASIGRNLTVGQNAGVSRDLLVGQDATVTRNLAVLQNANANGNLWIGQDATVNRNLNVNGNLWVRGARAYMLGTDGWGFWFMAGGTTEGVHNALGFNFAQREVGGGWKKTFVIDHPLAPADRLLVHSTLEGPEVGVYYRGEAELASGAAEVELPHYFEALTRADGRTVQLTPVAGEGAVALAATEVRDGRFGVRALGPDALGQRFYWEVKAVRADVPELEVEREKPYL